MPITALYAGLLALLCIVLSLRVIGARRSARVALGDGGDKMLQRRIRVQANFVEYTPLALILIGLAESLRTDARLLHAIGGVLLIGRLVHAIGLSQPQEWLALRQFGMLATFAAIITAAGACVMGALRSGALW